MKYLKRFWFRTGDWFNRHILLVLFITFAVGGGFIVLLPSIVVKIPVGHKGVIYRPLSGGLDLNYVFSEGIHFIFPFNTMTQYSIALNVHKMQMEVMTSDLLKTKLSISFQYHIVEQTLPLLDRYVGKNYLDNYILPELTSAVRESFGKFNSREAFTSDIKKISMEVAAGTDNYLINSLSPGGLTSIRLVKISSFQLDAVELPQDVQKAIETKMVDAAKSDAMTYKIELAKQESTRKEIEAGGIKKYQDIVNSGLTDNYLKHEGIQATLKLAESNNSKIVIYGSSNGGLPLILGDNDSGRAADSNSSQKNSSTTTSESATSKTTTQKSDSKTTTESVPDKTTTQKTDTKITSEVAPVKTTTQTSDAKTKGEPATDTSATTTSDPKSTGTTKK
jgi:regulator of protease activity HflC (stomatin/prohibitin superfamily)